MIHAKVMMMKISKCKKELARIISKNGGWRNGEFAAQDGDGGVGGYDVKPEWSLLGKYWRNKARCGWFLVNKIKNHHQTVLSRAEYFHLYPVPDADGWIEWSGGKCPVGEGDRIDVKFSDGDELFDVGSDWGWDVDAGGCNIIAYRLHKPQKSEPQYCESVTRSIPEPDEMVWTNPPTIEQLAADYRNAKGYALRLQEEANNAWTAAEKVKGELIDAGRSIGIDVQIITAKQEPQLVITDWRALRVGDEVECVDYDNEHRFGVVRSIDERAASQWVGVLHPNMDVSWPSNWRFIRRP